MPGCRSSVNEPSIPLTMFSRSPRMMPSLFFSSNSVTFAVPPFVTSNVTGPALARSFAGEQPSSVSVTGASARVLPPDAALVLLRRSPRRPRRDHRESGGASADSGPSRHRLLLRALVRLRDPRTAVAGASGHSTKASIGTA